jgi:hypothetical protein
MTAGLRHGRLAAGLSAAWEAELTSARRMADLAERTPSASHRSRLLVLAAFCRAHASRLLARISAMGKGPLPVPSEEDPPMEAPELLKEESARARLAAGRYAQLAQLARTLGDVSSAWVCELNRSEEEERARELLLMCETQEGQLDTSAHV